jgi:LPS-assembly protein
LANLPLNQINLSTAIPLSNSLDSFARFEYDFKNKHIVNTAVGFEYQTCCLAFRFVAERAWQPNLPNIHIYDNQFKFQVIFKGLAGVGTADNKYLANLVPGYSYQDKW